MVTAPICLVASRMRPALGGGALGDGVGGPGVAIAARPADFDFQAVAVEGSLIGGHETVAVELALHREADVVAIDLAIRYRGLHGVAVPARLAQSAGERGTIDFQVQGHLHGAAAALHICTFLTQAASLLLLGSIVRRMVAWAPAGIC